MTSVQSGCFYVFVVLPCKAQYSVQGTQGNFCLLVGCLTSQQHANVSQGRICSDNFTCCHTEVEVADQTFHLTHSHYTDTGPTSLSTDPITPGAWQGSHWSTNFEVTGMTRPRKNPGSSALEADALTTRPTRRSHKGSEHSGKIVCTTAFLSLGKETKLELFLELFCFLKSSLGSRTVLFYKKHLGF